MLMLARYNTILQTPDVHIFTCIIRYFLQVSSLKLSKLSILETKYFLGNYSDFSRLAVFLPTFGTEDLPEQNSIKLFPFPEGPFHSVWGLMADVTDSDYFLLDAMQ